MVSVLRRVARKLPAPVKIEIHRAVSAFSFLYNKGSVTTPDGQFFEVPSNMSPVDYKALKRGDYERAEITILKNYFRPEHGTIIDVGANIGVVARYAIAEKLLPGGTYIAVEPNPSSFKALNANMQRARDLYPERDIRPIVKAAVGDPAQEGMEAPFFARPNLGSGLASVVKAAGRETTIHVPMTSLSSIIEKSPAGRPISVICDSEGGEIPMIYKDSEALSKVHQIAIELHGPKITGRKETPADMIDQLAHLGFRHRAQIHLTHYFSQSLNRA